MTTATAQTQEPYVRLLVCHTCKSIEELPPYDGPAEYDTLLQISAARHGETHSGRLFNVSALHWNSPTLKSAIIDQIRIGSPGLDVFGTQFYSTKMTFHEDAMTCFKAHLRPKEGCPEFRTDKKELLPGTNSERRDLGLSPIQKTARHRVYVCDFCPVRVYYAKKYNDAKGISA